MLGIREPEIYGNKSYDDLCDICFKAGDEAGFDKLEIYQSNYEGDLVTKIQEAYGEYDGIIINAGAYTHTSVAILDALKCVQIPTIEVHISNLDKREKFRKVSYLREACFLTIHGEGLHGYEMAIDEMKNYLTQKSKNN